VQQGPAQQGPVQQPEGPQQGQQVREPCLLLCHWQVLSCRRCAQPGCSCCQRGGLYADQGCCCCLQCFYVQGGTALLVWFAWFAVSLCG
jgi:hypothetical protein